MRAFTYAVSAAALMVMGTFSAQAADLIIDEPAVVPGVVDVGNWEGAYIGVFGGYAWGDLSYVSPDVPDGSADYSAEADGFVAGVQAGYNWQFDQLVFGLQTDFAYVAGETDEGDRLTWLGTTTGRVGVALDDLLIYGKAGLAYGMSEASFTWGPDTTEGDEWHVGWTAGAGLEYAISEGVSVFAEYNYVDLGDANYFANVGPIGPAGVDVDYNAHVIKAGLNLSF